MASTNDENSSTADTQETEAPDIALTAVPAITKHFRLQFEKAQDSWVLLYPEGMIKLNSAAAEIMQRCDGETSIEKIIAGIEESFEETGLQADIVSFFKLASENKWVTLA
jgi:pyrroloquinoline quinone biosynthesis protein D